MADYTRSGNPPQSPVPAPLPAGHILAAARALDRHDRFSRAQVAHLLALAYASGARARTALDLAELAALHEEAPMPRHTAEQRRAARRAEMDAAAARAAAARTPRRFWPVTMPGGWPLPPELPGPEDTWWPEDDGWPVPPPGLRGGADQ